MESPLAGETCMVVKGMYEGLEFEVEDYACNVFGSKTWLLEKRGNPAVIGFRMTHTFDPSHESRALYGKIGGLGVILAETEVALKGAFK